MSKLSKKEKEKRDALTARIEAAKLKLPTSGITSLYRQRYPQLCDKSHESRVSNVLTSRVFDADITARIETIAKLLAQNVEDQNK